MLTLAWMVTSAILCQWLLSLGGSRAEGAANLPESALGRYSSSLLTQWRVLDELDADEAVDHVPNTP